ncbi:MAG: hypothetical protein LCH63_03160 [Candidatus Melainabacteria bacterium]|nr:hypothetical protein [Candidatus Melainabacteria bacterium]
MKADFLRFSRKQKGFSLISVTAISATALLFLAGTAAAIMPIFKWVGTESSEVRLQVALDSSVDYALAGLNDMSSRANFDPGASIDKVVAVPQALVDKILPGGSIQIKVSKFSPEALNPQPSLKIYSDEYGLDSSAVSALSGKGLWRQIEATALYGTMRKKVYAVCRPRLSAKSLLNSPMIDRQNSYFSDSALTSVDSIWLGSGTSTKARANGVDVSFFKGGLINQKTGEFFDLGGNVSTYGYALLTNADIGGAVNLKIEGVPQGKLENGGDSQVSQYLVVNDGQQSGFSDGSGGDATNVFGDGNSNLPAVTPALDAAPNTDPTIAPALAPPSGVSNSGNVTLNTSSAPVTSGDYVVDSLSVSGTPTISPSGDLPIRYFVEGSGKDAVSISGSLSAGNPANPAQFQIWYDGSGNILIDQSNVSAVIYAPNSNVIFRGNGIKTFSGAIVAKTISGGVDGKTGIPNRPAENLRMTYDFALKESSKNKSNASYNSLGYNKSDFEYPLDKSNLYWQVFKVYSPPNLNWP